MIWLITSLVLTLLSYVRVLSGFFQQDEWYGFSEFILRQSNNLSEVLTYFFAPSIVHFTPFTIATLYGFLSIFGMNYQVSAVFSIILHTVVVYLVYLLAKDIFSSKTKVGLTTILFATFSGGYQATSWVMANVATHGSTIFGLLSMIWFLRYLKQNTNKTFFISLTFYVISVLFKEITLGLIPLMLILVWFYGKRDKQKKVHATKVLVGFGIIYVVLRLMMIPFVEVRPGSSAVFHTQSASKFVYNLVTIPVKIVAQSVVPIEVLRGSSETIARLFSEKVSGKVGTTTFETFVLKRVMEFVTLAVSVWLIAVSLKKTKRTIPTIFGLSWVIINSIIFAMSSERVGVIFVIDSRNLYFVSIGSAILLSELLSRVKGVKQLLLIATIILMNLYYLNFDLTTTIERGRVRREILSQMITSVPNLPDKVVIYTVSDRSYYGLPEEVKILPFQSGLGQTLLAWYYPSEIFPKEFFKDRFLWEIDSEGYKEVNGVGFGYFRDIDLLKETVKKYNLPESSVYAFSWDGDKERLTEISEEVRDNIYVKETY